VSTTTPTAHDLDAHIASLREALLASEDGYSGSICTVDGYPSTMVCTCVHGHGRHYHAGDDTTRCMSYAGQPDCPCTGYVPAPAAVAALWEAHLELLRALDVEQLTELPIMLPKSWRRRFARAVVVHLVGAP